MAVIYRGEDKSIQFTLTDANGDPLVINDLTGIIIFLWHQSTVLARYNIDPSDSSTLSGYNPITVDDSAAGQVSIKLAASVTRNSPLGEIKAEVKVRITPSDTEDSVAVVSLGTMEEARTRNETTFT